jgi:lipopolysaccharide export system protein LptC
LVITSYVLTDATTTSTAATTSSGTSVSAEDALNTHQKKMALRSEVFNKARTAHMKEFQARFTKELQVQLIEGVGVTMYSAAFFMRTCVG